LPASSRLIVAFCRLVLVASVAALFAAPWLFEPTVLTVLTEFLCLLVLALMWNLLAGYADIVTVGQHAFVGVGAYAFYGFAVLAKLNPYLAIPLAGVAALVAAVPAMSVVLRLRAAYLAVGTWVIAEVLMLISGKLPGFGTGSGVSLPVSVARVIGARPEARFIAIYWLALALAVLAYLSTYLLLRSRIGLGLTAMRDNEEAAGAMGVNLTRTRILCFLWTAPFLGLAGAIITLQKFRIAPPASFSIIDWTVFVIFNVVIGGVGSLEGPILGTVLFFVLRQYLSDLGTWHLIILGSLSITVMLIEPRGLWGLLRRVIPADLIPVSHAASPGFGPARRSTSVAPAPDTTA
jgi:branched-chain amino acid transport system permease protein